MGIAITPVDATNAVRYRVKLSRIVKEKDSYWEKSKSITTEVKMSKERFSEGDISTYIR